MSEERKEEEVGTGVAENTSRGGADTERVMVEKETNKQRRAA